MTNTIAAEELPPESDFPEEEETEDPYTPSGKQRSMTPVMCVLVLAALGFIGFHSWDVVAGVQLLQAGNDFNRGLIGRPEMDAILDQINVRRLSPNITGGIALAIVVAFLWFNVRAVSNLRAFSLRHVPASPLGVVLWQFAPFLNLAKPYSIMMMLWSRSREHAGEPTESPAAGFWWWASWLAAILFTTLSRVVDTIDADHVGSGPVETIPLRALGLATVATVCFIISTLALLLITSGIARTQNRIRKR